MNVTPHEELPIAIARLALQLATNSIAALHQAQLLPPGQAEYCAAAMRSVAELCEQAIGLEALPPLLAEQLHTLAAAIDPRG